jgi:hypothetical protein
MRILSPVGAYGGVGRPALVWRAAPFALDAIAAGAALLCVRLGALLLTPDGAPPRIYAALALGCAGAAVLGGLTVARAARARRPLAVAWALILLWPLAGPPAAAAGLAVLGCAGVVACTVRPRWAALPAVAAVALLLVVAVQRPETSEPAVQFNVATAPAGASHDTANAPRAGASDDTAAAPQPPPARDADRAAAPTSPGPPEAAVLDYYRALDARRFDRAWATLSPAIRSSFGGRARWRAGFATTRSSRPSHVRVVAVDGATTVRHVMTATDRTHCGLVVQRYEVTWTLTNAGGRWRAAALSGRLLGGGSPACSR